MVMTTAPINGMMSSVCQPHANYMILNKSKVKKVPSVMPKRFRKVYATDIVAVAYTGSEIPVFEKSEAFWIYAVDETKIVRMQILSVYSGKIPDTVRELELSRVDAVICRNFGPKAMSSLHGAGMRLYTFDGGAKAAVNAFAEGKLKEL